MLQFYFVALVRHVQPVFSGLPLELHLTMLQT